MSFSNSTLIVFFAELLCLGISIVKKWLPRLSLALKFSVVVQLFFGVPTMSARVLIPTILVVSDGPRTLALLVLFGIKIPADGDDLLPKLAIISQPLVGVIGEVGVVVFSLLGFNDILRLQHELGMQSFA